MLVVTGPEFVALRRRQPKEPAAPVATAVRARYLASMTEGVADRRSEWLPSPRRLRVRFGGETVADSTQVMLLRQHGFLPVYYVPEGDVRMDLLAASTHTTFSPYKGRASYFDVHGGGRVARAGAWTYPTPLAGSPPTTGYLSFHWHGMDAWFEEDEEIFVHARDPYLRVDALPSSRHVVVRLAGEVVADTRRPVLLLETGLVTRYYVPPMDVRLELFEGSDSYSMCPYKGLARYRSFVHGATRIADAAWSYAEPLREVAEVAGHLCFWNERPETSIEVDGAVLPTLGLRRSGPGGELLYPSRRFFTVPPPPAMRGAALGGLQHDHARPNGRAEGPPDDVIDMAVERSGGRRPSSVPRGAVPRGRQEGGARPSLLFTFGRSAGTVPPLAEPVDLGAAPVCERSPRRVRAFAGGLVVADSKDAILYVGAAGEAGYAFPAEDVSGLLDAADLIAFDDPAPGLEALRGHLGIRWGAARWFEEDEEIRGGPRVPYHRVDCLQSSRHVLVRIAGVTVAESGRCVVVFETGEPARCYLPPLGVVPGVLTPSGRRSESPYLGEALWYAATIGTKRYDDVAWSYTDPLAECPKLAGLVCFDERHVDIAVEGLPR